MEYEDVDYGNNENNNEEYVVIDSEDVVIEDSDKYQEENNNFDMNGLVEYQKIDWENPITITEYGVDLIKIIGKLQSNKNALVSNSETNREKISKLIDEVTNFINNMKKEIDKGNKETAKEVPATKELAVVSEVAQKAEKGVRRFFKWGQRQAIKMKTGGAIDNITDAEYNDFKDNIRELSSLIDTEKENMLQEIEIYKDYLKESAPYLRTFEFLIKDGKRILDERKVEIKNKYGNRKLDRFEELQYNEDQLLIDELEFRLNDLDQELFMLTDKVHGDKTTLLNAGRLKTHCDKYINIILPMLESKGESIKFVDSQRKRINTLQELDDMTNTVYKTTSDVILSNVKDMNKIIAGGTYDLKTMETIMNNVKDSIDAFNNVKNERNEIIRKKERMISQFQDTLRTSALTMGESYRTTFAITEESSVQTDEQEVGKRRVRK